MVKVKLAAPWVTFYREVGAMFDKDEGVMVLYDEDDYSLKIYVEDADKADAISQLMPTEKVFGNITMKITVIPGNKILKSSNENLFNRAFNGNLALSYVKTLRAPFLPNGITYVVFEDVVVQYYTDNMCDINGMTSTLYENIARNIFNAVDGVYYCTELSIDY